MKIASLSFVSGEFNDVFQKLAQDLGCDADELCRPLEQAKLRKDAQFYQESEPTSSKVEDTQTAP